MFVGQKFYVFEPDTCSRFDGFPVRTTGNGPNDRSICTNGKAGLFTGKKYAEQILGYPRDSLAPTRR